MTYSRGLDRPRRIFLAVPTYSGQVGAGFLVSLFESQALLHAAGIGVDLCIEAGNCHVDDARNALVRQFLQTDCSDLVFLDADIAWQGEDLLKLVSYDRDVVAGVYPKKQDDPDYPVMTLPGPLQADAESNYELVEVEGAPTGFLRISRACLEAMDKQATHFQGQGAKPDDVPYSLIFERIIQGGRRMSGDYAFCWKWRKAGGKIWVAPEMSFDHEGSNHWSGRLGDFWRRRAGLEHAEVQKCLQRLTDGDDNPEVFARLHQAWGNAWAGSPELLAAAYRLALSADGPILETGSGLTTLVMGVAAKKRGGRVFALEASLEWRRRVLRAADGLPVALYHAPLKSYPEGDWYNLHGVTLPETFALVLCDGPSRKDGNRSVLFNHLGERIKDALVLLDDADDPAQIEPLRAWSVGRSVDILGKFALSRRHHECVQSAV